LCQLKPQSDLLDATVNVFLTKYNQNRLFVSETNCVHVVCLFSKAHAKNWTVVELVTHNH